MAGELTGGIIKWAADKLSTLLPPPSATSSSSDSPIADVNDLRQLERTMNRIQTLLIEAGERDIRDRSEMLRLRELKEVAMDAEDLVEDYSYQVLHAKIQTRNRMNGEGKSEEVITDLSSIVVSVPVPEEMAVRVRMIRERFDEILKEWESLRWMESDGARRRGLDTERRPPSSSLLLDPFVHGRCQDKENVIEFLLKGDENSDNNGAGCVCVLPIVGMGGVGKTTLAQLVYNDLRVSQHFDMKGWVCVSEEFDVKSLTEIIVTALTKKPCGPMQLNDLQIILSEKIKGKKVLLILDDVWNERPSLWYSLRSPFLHSLLSKVIVTTRSEKVARIMQTIPFYPLHCLDFGNSWRLFMQVAFENQDPGEHGNLVQIGKKITMKCGGLPLAIKAIGCALHFEMDVEVWIDILESDIWESEAGRNEVLPALQLSYICMPTQLKQCFMFLSLFPKDYLFFKDMIIKLWASLGFLNSKGTKSMTDIGTIYFDDLQQRSMVKKVQYDEKTCFYIMHDLVHKLAEFVAGELFARKENSYLNAKPFYTRFVRYLNVVVIDPKNIDLVPIRQLDSLRFLQVLNTANQWMSKDITINFHSGFFENLKYLRAVDFSYTGITDLPDSIGNLKQLRYLGLTKTDIKYLPESICLLYNLQTLDLLGCPLEMLPRDIRNLVNLQHLNIAKWSSVSIPRGIGHLTNLITLPAFHMDGYSSCEISELRNLKYIQGGLCITGLANVRDFTDVVLANLQNKKQITCLTLDWSSDKPETQNHSSNLLPNPRSSECVLLALKPQENLQMLEIYRYPGLTYPRWLGDVSYTKLVEIVLFGNREISSSFLPSLGRLPFLRNLSIQCMLNVNCVGHEFCSCYGKMNGFRSLNTLEFKYMPRWVQWWGIENGEFCSLNILKIVRCNALKFMPPSISMSLTKLVVNHCKELMKLPTLPSLTSLILMGQLNKHLFANLYFPSLKFLEIGFSHNIRAIVLLSLYLTSLTVLVIKSCKNLEFLIGLDTFTSLNELDLDGCPCLTHSNNSTLPPFLQFLRIRNCPQLADISNFGNESQKIKEAIYDEEDAHEYDDIDITTEENDEPPWNDLWGDSNDYGINWLLSTSTQLQEHDKKEYPTTSRKRDRNSIMKNLQNSSYKGKEKVEYSSGSSFGGNDSELGSFGGTSEEEF
ncbi:hypothetical protein LUZ60_005303 [Juncus effusus]|nr:hypothetical protein LUZ60_005303 [Juncus effusus]